MNAENNVIEEHIKIILDAVEKIKGEVSALVTEGDLKKIGGASVQLQKLTNQLAGMQLAEPLKQHIKKIESSIMEIKSSWADKTEEEERELQKSKSNTPARYSQVVKDNLPNKQQTPQTVAILKRPTPAAPKLRVPFFKGDNANMIEALDIANPDQCKLYPGQLCFLRYSDSIDKPAIFCKYEPSLDSVIYGGLGIMGHSLYTNIYDERFASRAVKKENFFQEGKNVLNFGGTQFYNQTVFFPANYKRGQIVIETGFELEKAEKMVRALLMHAFIVSIYYKNIKK